MAESKNPLAKRDGRIITINDLSENEKGLKCGCKCPVCDGTFLARMGEQRSWHFAHSGEPCDAAKQITNSSYQLVAQAISEKGYFTFPGLYVYCNLTQIMWSYYDNFKFDSLPKPYYEKLFGIGKMSVKTVEIKYNSKGIGEVLIINDQLAVKLSIDTEYCVEKNISRYDEMATLCIDIDDAIYHDDSVKLSMKITDDTSNKRWVYSPRISKWIEPLEEERVVRYNAYLEQKQKEEEQRRIEAEERRQQEIKRQEEFKKRIEKQREEELKRLEIRKRVLEEPARSSERKSNDISFLPNKRKNEYRPSYKQCSICYRRMHPEDIMWGKNTHKYYCHKCIENNGLSWREL